MENYQYLKKISSGSFSNVGLYKNKNKYYAIKIPNNQYKYQGILCNELREIISLNILKNHKNIINIYEIFIDNKLDINLVYNYYPETLFNYFKRTYIFNRIRYCNSFCSQMLSVLHFLNLNSIIHTDLKPTNILIYFVNDEMIIKLIDFGSCHIEGLTSKYSIVTTYTHRAPEVFDYNMNYDYKIDIWSFGVILFKFITGQDILEYKIHNKSNDSDKFEEICNFSLIFDSYEFDYKYKFFLSKIFIIDPIYRYDIYNLIDLFFIIFNQKIVIYNKSTINYLIDKNDENLYNLNIYICDRISNVHLQNLNFGNFIISKLNTLNDLDYVTIWFLNYQFNHYDVEYTLEDFIYIFNSYYKKIYNNIDIHNNCYNILNLIDFNLF